MTDDMGALPVKLTWELRYAELRDFQQAYGHVRIPKGSAWSSLLNWVINQRRAYRLNLLSPKRVNALAALGFQWGTAKRPWEDWYSRCQQFAAAHGRADVVYINNYDKDLAAWVNRQKGALSRGLLSENQVQQLKTLGIQPANRVIRRKNAEVKGSREATLAELADYVSEHGHAHLPSSKDPASLCLRVRKLKHIATNRGDAEMVARLTELGVFRRYPDSAWEAAFSAWKSYVEFTGDFSCEQGAPERLISWVHQTRSLIAGYGGDRLQVPVAKRYPDRHIAAELKGLLHTIPRLKKSGFKFESTYTLSESDLIGKKVSRILGLPREWHLTLRTTLRILTHRTSIGVLPLDSYAELHRLGLTHNSHSNGWAYQDVNAKMRGQLIISPPAPPVIVIEAPSPPPVPPTLVRKRGRPRKDAIPLSTQSPGASPAKTAKPAAPMRQLRSTWSASKSAQAKDIPLLRAIKWQFSPGSPARSEADLLAVDEVKKYLTTQDRYHQRAELRRALTRLVDVGWLRVGSSEYANTETELYCHTYERPPIEKVTRVSVPPKLIESAISQRSNSFGQVSSSHGLPYGSISLLYAVKHQFEFEGITLTELDLLRLNSIYVHCIPGCEAQHRAELKAAITTLVDLQWLRYVPGDFDSDELRPLQRTAPILFG